MDERWHGSLFQKVEATDENDLDFAIAVFRLGTHSDNEEEVWFQDGELTLIPVLANLLHKLNDWNYSKIRHKYVIFSRD